MEILVRPCRPYLAVQPRFGVSAVPAKAETVPVDARRRLERLDTLRNQGMRGCRDVMFQGSRLSAIRNPTAHAIASPVKPPNVASRINSVTLLRQSRRLRVHFRQKMRN